MTVLSTIAENVGRYTFLVRSVESRVMTVNWF